MRKLLLILTLVFSAAFATHAQQVNEDPFKEWMAQHPQLKHIADSLEDVTRVELSCLIAHDFAKVFNLTPEQERLTARAYVESGRRWENGGNEVPLDFAMDSAAKAETKRFHEDLQNIFTYAQYKKYERSSLYREE